MAFINISFNRLCGVYREYIKFTVKIATALITQKLIDYFEI